MWERIKGNIISKKLRYYNTSKILSDNSDNDDDDYTGNAKTTAMPQVISKNSQANKKVFDIVEKLKKLTIPSVFYSTTENHFISPTLNSLQNDKISDQSKLKTLSR